MKFCGFQIHIVELFHACKKSMFFEFSKNISILLSFSTHEKEINACLKSSFNLVENEVHVLAAILSLQKLNA